MREFIRGYQLSRIFGPGRCDETNSRALHIWEGSRIRWTRNWTVQRYDTTLALNGSLEAKTRTVSSTSTLLTTDFAILASMAIILTLSAASTQNEMIIFVKNTSTSAVTVDPGSGDTIKGVASKSLSTHVILKQLFSQFFISIWFASILVLGKASIF